MGNTEVVVNTFFGYIAFLSAIATLCTFITGVLFFKKGGRWGTVNDISSIVQMLLMLPIVWVMFRMLNPDFKTISIIILVVGFIGVVVPIATQTLLVARLASFETSNRIGTPAGLLVGIWLISANVFSREIVSTGMAISGIAGGIGYILLVVGFLTGQHKHPLFSLGSILALTGYTTWAILLGIAVVS